VRLFLIPVAGFRKLAGMELTDAQLHVGIGIVLGLTLQAMILYALVGFFYEVCVKGRSQKGENASAN